MNPPVSSPKPVITARPDYPAMVFMVDDQAMVGEAVRRFLSNEADMNFHFCINPAEAIPLVAKIKPTVILQDLVMPQMDGLDLVRQYRANSVTRHTPIIVLSTKEEPQTKSDAFAAGANDYLVKLPDKIEMVARVRYHSRAYLNQIQRDEAFGILQKSQRELVKSNADLLALNQQLQAALAQVKQLQGLLPICSYCKRIRDDGDYWSQLETYFTQHSDVKFSHGICPPCAEKHFGVAEGSSETGR